MNDDTISRRAAIDRINKQREHLQPGIYPQDKIGDAAYRICAEFIERLPSAQPEKRTEERTETHACDCISRQAAIDAILAVTGNSSVRELYEHVQEHGLSDMWSGGVNAAIDIIIAVPSAQSEKSTTAEKSQLAEEKSTRKLIYLDDAIRIVESFYKVNADIRRIMAFELRQLPSAQPEIIHCRDCKHKGTKNCVANAWTTIFGVMVKDDFYCGLAERRTDDGD